MNAAAATIACTISAQFGPLPGPLPRLRLAMIQALGACSTDASDAPTFSCPKGLSNLVWIRGSNRGIQGSFAATLAVPEEQKKDM